MKGAEVEVSEGLRTGKFDVRRALWKKTIGHPSTWIRCPSSNTTPHMGKVERPSPADGNDGAPYSRQMKSSFYTYF